MTARSDLARAQQLNQALDNVTQALAIVNDPALAQTLVLSTPSSAGVQITLNIAVGTLTTMLTARQTAIQSALTALGVTG